MKRELEHLAKFLHLAVDYKMKIGFKGKFCIEPKPKEPTKHQYDSDAAACLNFLSEYDLLGDLKLVSGHWKLASQGRNEPASEIV